MISIVMLNYNYAHFLPYALEGVLNQAHAPDEFLIYDDASSDSSVDLIRSYEARMPYMRLIQNPENLGVVATMNKALKEAKGDYILFAASDDRLEPDCLCTYSSWTTSHPHAAFYSGQSYTINEQATPTGIATSAIPCTQPSYLSTNEVKQALCKYGSWFMGNTSLYRRQYLLDEGGFQEHLGAYTDSIMSTVLALKHGVVYIPKPMAQWRILTQSFSAQANANVEKTCALIDHTCQWLTAHHPGLVPDAYITSWKKRQRIWIAMSGITLIRSSTREYIMRMRTLHGRNSIVKLCLEFANLGSHIHCLGLMALSFLSNFDLATLRSVVRSKWRALLA